MGVFVGINAKIALIFFFFTDWHYLLNLKLTYIYIAFDVICPKIRSISWTGFLENVLSSAES